MPLKIWVIGQALMINGTTAGWMLEGVFMTEAEAVAAVISEDEFVAVVAVGERLPERAMDAEKLYWPKLETWETSELFKLRSKIDAA